MFRYLISLLLLTTCVQTLYSQQSAPVAPPAFAGFRLISTEMFTGNLNYQIPLGASIQGPQLTDGLTGGYAMTFGWQSQRSSGVGPDAGWSAQYRVTYDRNTVNSTLGGLSHDLRVHWAKQLSPRLLLAFTGSGTSTTFLSFTDVAGVPNADEDLASPLRLALAGIRRKEVHAGATATYALSPRSTWTFRADASRDLPSDGVNPITGKTGYSGATAAAVSTTYAYNLSPRSVVSAEASYSQTFSALVPNSVGTTLIRYQNVVTPKLTAFVEGGYSTLFTRFDGIRRTTPAPLGQVGLQWNHREFALQGSALTTVGDAYGLGSSSRSAAQLTLRRSSVASPWTYSFNTGYERLTGSAFPLIRDWLVTTSLGYRISRNVEARVETIWTAEIGSVFSAYPHWNRRGAKLSLIWFPSNRI